MITAGTINYGFSTGLGFNDMVYIFRTQSDGKILVGGNFTSYNNINTYYITRLEQDGSLDSTFANGSFLSDYVKAIDVLSDGKIIVGGHFTNYNGSSTDYLVKLNTDGTLSQQFPNGFNDIVRVVKVQSDDKILVGGAFTTFNGNTYNYFLEQCFTLMESHLQKINFTNIKSLRLYDTQTIIDYYFSLNVTKKSIIQTILKMVSLKRKISNIDLLIFQ